MAKKDNIKFDSHEGRFYIANKRAIKEDIKRWKEQYPLVDFDNFDDLLEKAGYSIVAAHTDTDPRALGTGLFGPVSIRSMDEVRKNPQKSFEDYLSTENLTASLTLSDKQKEKLGRKESAGKKQKRKYQPWRNAGDACFIIEDNRIKFYYKGEKKDLRLRNETNPHKLLFLFAAQNPLPQAEIKDICKSGTRPSDIAKQTNKKLNEKIAAMNLPNVPKDIAFVNYINKSKCYGLCPKILYKDSLD